MSHVSPPRAADERCAVSGTNSPIEQPFAPMAARWRPQRPNLLFIYACELGFGEIGAYGGAYATTPNIDRLARSGIRFAQACATAADRGEHERSLLIGRSGAARADEPDLLDILGDHGYRTGSFAAGYHVVDVGGFIGSRRAIPWAAYVRLRNGSTSSVSEHGREKTDQAIGRLIGTLHRTEQYRSTLVLLVGAASDGRAAGDRVGVPTMLSWPGQIPPRQRHDRPVLTTDWMPTLSTLVQAETGIRGRLDGVDLTTHLFDGGDIPARAGAGWSGSRAA